MTKLERQLIRLEAVRFVVTYLVSIVFVKKMMTTIAFYVEIKGMVEE